MQTGAGGKQLISDTGDELIGAVAGAGRKFLPWRMVAKDIPLGFQLGRAGEAEQAGQSGFGSLQTTPLAEARAKSELRLPMALTIRSSPVSE